MSSGDRSQPSSRRRWRLALLVLLLVAGVGFALTEPVDRGDAIAWGSALAESPWTAPMLVLLQVLLFALSLPGTLVVWVVAPFYPPLVATALMLVGSVLGAVAAYAVAGFLGDSVHRRLAGHRTFRILSTRSDFFTQAALRALPGFPHGVINYSAGLLRLSWPTYLLAAVVGLLPKWAMYCWAIHGLFQRGLDEETPGTATVLPLFLLALFLGLGSLITRRLKARAASEST